MELPVLRTVTRHGGLSGRLLNDSTFRYYFQWIVQNAGYYGELAIHALRHALVNVIDREIPLSVCLVRFQMLTLSGAQK